MGPGGPEPGDRSGHLTYEPHFGLSEKPFSLSADSRFLFKSRSHAVALTETVAAIQRREGLIVLTGEIGTGKTMLCRAVIDDLDRRTFSAFVADPFVSREDLLRHLLTEFGVTSANEAGAGALAGATRHELNCRLNEFLGALVPLQAFAVVMIDEAQNLTLPLLEEIRILADLEGTIGDRRYKLLQVVLVGQPELRERLKVPQLRQVNQRVTIRCELQPLERQDVEAFLTHRLSVAAGGASTVRFATAALDLVHHTSAGVPRLINLIADRAMHEAYVLGVRGTIEASHVWKAIAALGLDVRPARAPEKPGMGLIDLEATRPVAPAVADTTSQPFAAADEPFRSEKPRGAIDSFSALLRQMFSRVTLVAFALTAAAAGVWAGALPVSDRIAAAAAGPHVPQLPPSPVTAIEDALLATEGDAELVTMPPGTKTYVIEVALFSSRARALRSVQEIAAEGQPAYSAEVRLGSENRRFIQVLAGSYGSLAEAESALELIRELPGYQDARLRGTP